jgi:UDPglucose 6-dehydrogenase
MHVAVFGVGYVGLVTGTCLAEVGNNVVCVDVDCQKVENLNNGVVPIFEPGLEALVKRNHDLGMLTFTTDAARAITECDIIFIAVGTPQDEDGSADMRHVLAVARSIGQIATKNILVVNKSTVPVGTAQRVRDVISAEIKKRGVDVTFQVVSNPEFLKEGAAIDDCLRPDRIVLGASDNGAIEQLKLLYAPFNRNHDRIIVMDERSAELTKYAANAMLATKISFMNEVANIAERVGADIEMVRHGIGSDSRIGYNFIYPGAGYGGSCFPKDVRALESTAVACGYTPRILSAVEMVNHDQKRKLFELISNFYNGELSGKRFAVWGLSFKPRTDDMREAPSRTLLADLWAAGATVAAHDPEAMEQALDVFGRRDDLTFCENPEQATHDADALVIVTEWKNFWSPDFKELAAHLRDKVIFDGRNIYDPKSVEGAGLAYYGIGRGRSVKRFE